MAGNVPNASWHMYEPSPIETQLAMADPRVNPRAAVMHAGYMFERQAQQGAYDAQLAEQRAQQLAEFQETQRNNRATALNTALQHLGATPGGVALLRQLPGVGEGLQGVDSSAFEAGAAQAAQAKQVGEAGRGIGSMAGAGIGGTALLDAASRVLGGGQVVQGDHPLVAAARIRAAASGSRGGGGGGAREPEVKYDFAPGSQSVHTTITGGGRRGQVTPEFAARAIEQGRQFQQQAQGAAQAAGQSNNAQDRSARVLGGQPRSMTSLSLASPAATNSAINPFQGSAPSQAAPQAASQQSGVLQRFKQQNPAGYADVQQAAMRAGRIEQRNQGGRIGIVGASGNTYFPQ